MAKCQAVTRAGKRCSQSVAPGVEWCWNHDPDNSARRREAAARAGRSRGTPGLASQAAGYRARLDRIADDVLNAESGVGSKSAAVAVAAINAALRSLSIQARLSEHEELEPMLRALEEEIRWGG